MQVNPERLAQLNEIVLHKGCHSSFEEGHCALEVAAYLAGEPHNDHPECRLTTLQKSLSNLVLAMCKVKEAA